MYSKDKKERKKKLGNYAAELLTKLSRSIANKHRKLIGIPLQCRMLAETFGKEITIFCQSSESTPEI
jgi:hypothetical protein